jgi:hypothetical protein
MSYSVALTQPQKVNSITALSGRILEEIAAQVKPTPKLMQLQVFIGARQKRSGTAAALRSGSKNSLHPRTSKTHVSGVQHGT